MHAFALALVASGLAIMGDGTVSFWNPVGREPVGLVAIAFGAIVFMLGAVLYFGTRVCDVGGHSVAAWNGRAVEVLVTGAGGTAIREARWRCAKHLSDAGH